MNTAERIDGKPSDMSTALKIIDSLRTEFIQEAQSAPKLFKDLAKVEHYIAES
ncbi:MAG: hypothetical protein AABY54_01060 [Deltaproteobacteria bacterium]